MSSRIARTTQRKPVLGEVKKSKKKEKTFSCRPLYPAWESMPVCMCIRVHVCVHEGACVCTCVCVYEGVCDGLYMFGPGIGTIRSCGTFGVSVALWE